MKNIVNTLFSIHLVREQDAFPKQQEDYSAKKKAAEPDGVPVEVLKVIARTYPRMLLNMCNNCLQKEVFHED